MKGVWGCRHIAGRQEKCPNCGSASGAKSKCDNCGTIGCANCIGIEKPYDCGECGKGPVRYIE